MFFRKMFQTLLLISALVGVTACSATSAVHKGAYQTTQKTGAHRTTVTTVELGQTAVAGHTVPVRGVLVTPGDIKKLPAKSAPLIIVNHLRAPNCDNNKFAYPCAKNTSERRFDLGMRYYGEFLADHGYAVLIPDLGAAWVGEDTKEPYDQEKLWQKIVGKLVAGLKSDSQKTSNYFRGAATRAINSDQVGLFLHSRSASLVAAATELLGAQAIRTIFAYGPSYDTVEEATFSPAPPDIPYLAVTGDADADVEHSATMWLSRYVSIKNTVPIASVSVSGLGHNYINRTLSKAKIDDRIGCDLRDCPDARTHERVLTETSLAWFANELATPKNQGSGLKLESYDNFATELSAGPLTGISARWLALGQNVTLKFKAADFSGGKQCVFPEPMNPKLPKNSCKEPELGAIFMPTATPVAQFSDTITLNKPLDTAVDHIAVHLVRGDVDPQAKLHLTFANGVTHTVVLDANDPALQNRATAESNGDYLPGTVRVFSPEKQEKLVAVSISVAPGATLNVLGMDIDKF